MDGNGRWAAEKNLERQDGHREGARRVRDIAEACIDRGIKVLTVYAFSTENWGRAPDEVSFLMRLIPQQLNAERSTIFSQQVRIRILGELGDLPVFDRLAVQDIVEETTPHNALDLNIAFNYGGRAEIVRAIKQLIRDGVDPEAVNEELVSNALYTSSQPDPDLLIRTGGDQRSSNFLVWQSIYSEYYFTPTLWPDFTPTELDRAISEFGNRTRRFGLVPTGSYGHQKPSDG
jgi:undecaprenyl diphosphate synthase